MIKRTLYFSNPAYLSRKDNQLIVRLPEVEKHASLPETFKKEAQASIPIEDIGVVILDHTRLTITQYLIDGLLENNVALITCNSTHHPTGLLLNLSGHTLQTVRFKAQVEASLPLLKHLWQQTIKAKIYNQASLLSEHGFEAGNLFHWAREVKSGDSEGHEARAAAYYWKTLFQHIPNFTRAREGIPPNNLLNYGYAILRAMVARSLVGSGLLPTLGIHHRNQYNHYCLADDIMEPYRPFVDHVVYTLIQQGEVYDELNTSVKKQLLGIASIDVHLDDERSPLMIAIQRTTASLAQCLEEKRKKVIYPKFKNVGKVK
jgi:CRISPR-associated protein Cas1